MRTVSFIYHNQESLLKFMNKNKIENSEKLLIQVFSTVLNETFLKNLRLQLLMHYPSSKIVGINTEGFIYHSKIYHERTLISFTMLENCEVKVFYDDSMDDYQMGLNLAEDLKLVESSVLLLYSLGKNINGSEVIHGLKKFKNSLVTGANIFSTDDTYFIFSNDFMLNHGAIAISIYGNTLEACIDYNCSFQRFDAKDMIVTSASKNVLYELDGIPIKEIYRKYFGESFFDHFLDNANKFPIRIHKNDYDNSKFVLAATGDKHNGVEFIGDLSVGDNIRFSTFNKITLYRIIEKMLLKFCSKNIQTTFLFYDSFRAKHFNQEIIIDELKSYDLICNDTLGIVSDGEYYSSYNYHNSYFYSHSCTQLYLTEEPKILSMDEIGNMALINVYLKNVKNAFSNISEHFYSFVIDKIEQEEQEFMTDSESTINRERLASIGQLIGGIAHNLNTPLTGITGQLHLINGLIEKLPISSMHHNTLEEFLKKLKDKTQIINDYILYMTDVINTVKNHTTTIEQSLPDKFSLEMLFNKLELLMSFELKKNKIKLNKNIFEGIKDHNILGEFNSMLQVLINILDNSIHAYKGNGGCINIGAMIDYIQPGTEPHIKIFIEDFASGINEDVKRNLFKKMITTKGKDGTGIGLYISNMIIKAKFKGVMSVNSLRPNGTVVNI